MDINFDNDKTFDRFKTVDKVKVFDRVLTVKVVGDIVVFYYKNKLYHTIGKSDLYKRWVTVENKLHCMRMTNGFFAPKLDYILAEL